MQATFPAFRLNRNALFYMGLFALLAFFLLAPQHAFASEGTCHFQKTTARNIRSQPHDLLRCQLGRPLTNPKSQANVGVRNNSCYALHPG